MLDAVREHGGGEPSQSSNPTAALVELLQSKHALLILDNCEHLVTACARLALKVLQACPGLRILGTSRQALGVPGELVHRVPSMTLPREGASWTIQSLRNYEAVKLFLDRASFVDPAFTMNEENAATIVHVCRRLDGTPLALELAAARVSALALTEIAARLDNCFNLLVGEDRTATPRHQTLRATINWSYRDLPPEQQKLLARLSVFSGGWTIEAAEAVCADPSDEPASDAPLPRADICPRLLRLIDKSLVICERNRTPWRYRLQEMVRQFGRQKLDRAGDGTEAAFVIRRHIDFYVPLAETGEKTFARQDAPQPHVFDLERENFRAALGAALKEPDRIESAMRLVVALRRYWYLRGALREGINWFDRVLSHMSENPTALAFETLKGAGILTWRHGDHKAAAAHYQHALEMAVDLQRQDLEAAVRNNLGLLCRDREDHDAAQSHFVRAMRIYDAIDDRFNATTARVNLGYEALVKQDYPTAREILTASLPMLRDLGNREGLAACLLNLGFVDLYEGRLDEGGERLRESLRLKIDLDDRVSLWYNVKGLAHLAAHRGRPEKAVRLYALAHQLWQSSHTYCAPEDTPEGDTELQRILREMSADQFNRLWQEGLAIEPSGDVLRGLADSHARAT